MQVSNLNSLARWILIAVAAGSLGTARASDGSRLYAACAGCHRPNAWGSTDGVIPSLAGQQRRYLERQLALFQSGARVDAATQGIAAHQTVGDAHAAVVLANYLAVLGANPTPFEGAADLHKDFAPPEMTSAIRGMRAQEKDALADHVSRLSTSDVLLDPSHVEQREE